MLIENPLSLWWGWKVGMYPNLLLIYFDLSYSWKQYWSHPSSKTPIICDPSHWFSSCLDRNSWVLMEQVTLHSKMFTRKLWWFSSTLQSYHISLDHSLSQSPQLCLCSLNKCNPTSFSFSHSSFVLPLVPSHKQRTASFVSKISCSKEYSLLVPHSSQSISNSAPNSIHFAA